MRHEVRALSIGATLFASISIASSALPSRVYADDVAPVQNPEQVLITPDYRGDFLDRSTISGDWAGRRQELANHGVTLDANLTQVAQGVVSGGRSHEVRSDDSISDWEYMGRGETTLNVDTSKAGLWPGGVLTVMGEGNYGDNLISRTGSILGTNINTVLPEVDNGYVLSQVTYTQFFSKQFGIAIGKFATISNTSGDNNEFAHGKGSTQFLALPFNINPILALTVPYSTMGATAIYLPTEDLKIMGGVLDPHGKASTSGFDPFFQDGVTFTLEGRYTTGFGGLTGHQTLGGTYSNSQYTDLNQGVGNLIIPSLPTKQHDGSWAAYWNADQYLFQPDKTVDRGFGLFARYGLSDGEANPIQNFASFGVGGKGLICGREYDQFGIGYYYAWTGDNRITNQLGFGDAQGWEAYYDVALTRAIHLAPDLQYVDPSQNEVASSWVMGFRLSTIF